MHLTDSVEIGGVRRTRDGYLVADAKVARTGIQVYAGREVGRPDLAEVRVYRPETEVFSQDAMSTVAWRPITIDHPSVMVDATNWKDLAVGFTGDKIARDGAFIRVPLTVMDQAGINAIQAGRRELSLGYTCELEFKDGKTPAGEAYDAVQTNIRVNHLAICSAARGGPDLRIGDQQEHQHQGGPTVALKTVFVDGLAVETTDAGEHAINKLKGMLDAAGKALEGANAEHSKAIAAKDAELGQKDARIKELESQVVTGDALTKLVTDHSAVVAKAKQLAPNLVTDGKTTLEIKRAAVAAKLGDASVKDRSDDYVGGLFDHLGGAAKASDPVREVIADGLTNDSDLVALRDKAKAGRLDYLNTAHRAAAN